MKEKIVKERIADVFVGFFVAGLITSVVLSITCENSYSGAIAFCSSIGCLTVAYILRSCQEKKK